MPVPTINLIAQAHLHHHKEKEKPQEESSEEDEPYEPIWAAAAPSCGMPVTWIHGLDEYSWHFGTHMAGRSKKRHEDAGPPKDFHVNEKFKRPQSAPHVKKSSSKNEYAQMVKGSSWAAASWAKTIATTADGAIFWNTDAPPADTGAFLVLKRRQKLKNDIVKEIVVSFGTNYEEVFSVFQIFEFYADDVEDPVLPTLPAQEQDKKKTRAKTKKDVGDVGDALYSNEAFQQHWDVPFCMRQLKHVSMASMKFKANLKVSKYRRMAIDNVLDKQGMGHADMGSGTDAQVWDNLIGRYKIPRKTDVPKLQMDTNNGAYGAYHASLDASAWDEMISNVSKSEIDHKVLKTLQNKTLNETRWESIKSDLSQRRANHQAQIRSSFEGALNHMLDHHDVELKDHHHEEHNKDHHKDHHDESRLSSKDAHTDHHKDHHDEEHKRQAHSPDSHHKVKEHGARRLLHGSHTHLDTECPEAVILAHVKSAVSKLPPESKIKLRQTGKNNIKEGLHALLNNTQDHAHDFEQRSAFLRASSSAIMGSNILKPKDGGEKTKFKSRREVLNARTHILQGISLPEMSKDNLFTVLHHFGTSDKRSVDRIFTCLVQNAEGKGAGAEKGLRFQNFFCLFRALEPAPHESYDDAGEATTTTGVAETFSDLEMIRRFIFHVIAEPSEGGKSAELTVTDVVATLRRLLCTSVLHDVDRTGNSRDARRSKHETATPTATPRHRTSEREQSIRNRSSLEKGAVDTPQGHHPISRHAVNLLGELLHMWFTHQEQRKRHNTTGTCDQAAIDKFAGKWPTAFICLFRLLFPLALQGREFARADMELAQKGLFHRRGEIHAKMNTRINKTQRDMLRGIWEAFVQPQLAERARRIETRDLRRKRTSTAESVSSEVEN